VSAPYWQRDPGLQLRYSRTSHTMRITIARAPSVRGEWHCSCREVAFDYAEIDRSAEMSVEAVQAAALAMVRERLAEMTSEVST
jgi:hypothetical protein